MAFDIPKRFAVEHAHYVPQVAKARAADVSAERIDRRKTIDLAILQVSLKAAAEEAERALSDHAAAAVYLIEA